MIMALTEEEMKERFTKFQTIQQQMEKLSEHAQLLNQHNEELQITTNAVTELGKTAVNTEILTPLADGIFLKANLLENQKLVVNVGSNTTVERTISEVLDLLGKQKEDLALRIIEAESVLQELNAQGLKIYQEVERERG